MSTLNTKPSPLEINLEKSAIIVVDMQNAFASPRGMLDIAGRDYDVTMPTFSDTGKFEAKPLAVLARSFVQMGAFDKEPDMSKLYTEKFLPSSKP